MTKTNNKGFSLIEVVIAVAILSLLVSPILLQVAQTLQTSAKAKEKQAAVDNAKYVFEYFQKTDLDALGKDGQVTINSKSSSTGQSCMIYTVGSSGDPQYTTKTVEYNWYSYYLDSVNLGKKQNSYSRQVFVDDLSNKLLANGYIVKYTFTDEEKEKLVNAGFTATSEGSYFKKNASGVYTAVVCETKNTTGYTDPNSVSLGFIQDLDASKVAIIQGDAANFDTQAATQLLSIKLDKYREVNEAGYNQIVNHPSGNTAFLAYDSVYKITNISINYDSAAACYVVKCVVTYEDEYKFDASQTTAYKDSVEYTVFSQKFYTQAKDGSDKAPDIYFIYEPFVSVSKTTTSTTGTTYSAEYALADFINVTNDVDSQGAKLYLIKPDNNRTVNSSSTNSGYTVKTPTPQAGTTLDPNTYYTTNSSGKAVPVKIYINKSTTTTIPLDVFTNINISNNISNLKGDGASGYPTMKGNANRTQYPMADSSRAAADGHKEAYIRPISEDKNIVSRLYTISVRLTGTETLKDGTVVENVTTFEGAKGAN